MSDSIDKDRGQVEWLYRHDRVTQIDVSAEQGGVAVRAPRVSVEDPPQVPASLTGWLDSGEVSDSRGHATHAVVSSGRNGTGLRRTAVSGLRRSNRTTSRVFAVTAEVANVGRLRPHPSAPSGALHSLADDGARARSSSGVHLTRAGIKIVECQLTRPQAVDANPYCDAEYRCRAGRSVQ